MGFDVVVGLGGLGGVLAKTVAAVGLVVFCVLLLVWVLLWWWWV